MVFPKQRDFSFTDHTRPIAGGEGQPALQSQGKLVTRTGATEANADIDISNFDVANDGDFETGVLNVGGTSAVALSIVSEQNENFEAQIDLVNDDGVVLSTIDGSDYGQLTGSTVNVSIPVFSDRIIFRITDTSAAAQNVLNGSVNINVGSATTIDAQLTANEVQVTGANSDLIEDETLNTDVAGGTMSLVTYISRALNSNSLDEFVTRVTNSNGVQVDPITNDVQQSQSNDEVRTRLLGVDGAGGLVETQAESLDTAVAAASVGHLTYLARALDSQGLDEFVTRVTDSAGVQVNPLTTDPLNSVANDELRSRIHDSAGAQIDPLNQDALETIGVDELRTRIHDSAGNQIDPLTDGILQSIANDEARARIFAPDSGGQLQQILSEALNTNVNATDVGLLTYLARALNSQGQDELVTRVTDDTGTQIKPDEAPEYPQQQVTGYDLVASGDLTIGPVSVARTTAILLVVNSTSGNSFDVSVDWQDSNGNVFQTEAPADISMNNVVDDYARLVRKGPEAVFTLTDTSGAANNVINAYVDAHR